MLIKCSISYFNGNSHVGSRGIVSVNVLYIYVCDRNVGLFFTLSKLYSLILSQYVIEHSSLYLILGHLKNMSIMLGLVTIS